jgi:hypothetical protein
MNKNKYFLGAAWLINFLLMLVVILLPKSEGLFNSLYFVFLGCVFVVPGILLVCQLYIYNKNNIVGNHELYIPVLGCVLLMSLTFIRFIVSMKKEIIPQMIVILCTFIMAEILVGFLLSKIEKFSKGKYLFGSIAIYVLLVLFFFSAMIISYDHSIIW